MNNKITFPRLAAMLADKSGRSKRFAEDFLREFFSLVSETLEIGESVKIKDIGSFRLSYVEPRKSVDVTTGLPMEISGHTKVVFTPAKELAEKINSPFEAFAPIEIPAGFDLESLDEDLKGPFEPSENLDKDSGPEESPEETNFHEESSDRKETVEEEKPAPNQAELVSAGEKTPISRTPSPVIPEDLQVEEELAPEENYESGSGRSWTHGFIVGIFVAAAAFMIVFFVWRFYTSPIEVTVPADTAMTDQTQTSPQQPESGEKEDFVKTAPEDTLLASAEKDISNEMSDAEVAAVVATAPSDIAVYDTVSTTRYLITIAKAHYGNAALWPIIYEENKEKLGDPDRIRPGTPVVVPSLSKYGIDPKKKEDVDRAKRMGAVIYSKYGK